MPDASRRVVALTLHASAEEWRRHARALLADGIAPENVDWLGPDERGLFQSDAVSDLFAPLTSIETPPTSSPRRRPGPSDVAPAASKTIHKVPRDFVDSLPWLLSHSDPQRFGLAYRLLWRIAHGESRLLERITDPDVFRVREMQSAVRRDHHKMKAFVRFREIDAGDGGTAFIAWFEPSHYIVDLASSFFAKRFASMRWSILTPYRSVHWDGSTLHFTRGASKSDAPDDDRLESLWRTYYANIFNPARLKIDAMQREMPVKYWKNLPEAHLIGELVRDASRRMETMVDAAPTVARKQFPAPAPLPVPIAANDIDALRIAARSCRACPLWEPATQTVFGEGPEDAQTVVIGEQPGDQEDLAGRPFVGPAGQMLDRALHELGIEREQLYLTNAVKHFKFEPRGRMRLHKRAAVAEQNACRRWLDAEIARIKPKRIVCLGATAATAVFGRDFALLRERGRWIDLDGVTQAFATVHPSYLLRLPANEQDAGYRDFLRDLALLRDAA